MRTARRKTRKKRFVILLAFLLVACFIYIAADAQIRPLITAAAKERAVTLVNQIINDTVADVIKQENADYDSFIDVKYAEDGSVQSLETKATALNAFRAEVNSAIIGAVANYDCGKLRIRLGTLLGDEYLIGRGPAISFRYDLSNTVTSQFKDAFESAGINQTKHKIMLHIKTDITILIPWYNTSTSFETDILICDTVIVGAVPDTYVSIAT